MFENGPEKNKKEIDYWGKIKEVEEKILDLEKKISSNGEDKEKCLLEVFELKKERGNLEVLAMEQDIRGREFIFYPDTVFKDGELYGSYEMVRFKIVGFDQKKLKSKDSFEFLPVVELEVDVARPKRQLDYIPKEVVGLKKTLSLKWLWDRTFGAEKSGGKWVLVGRK